LCLLCPVVFHCACCVLLCSLVLLVSCCVPLCLLCPVVFPCACCVLLCSLVLLVSCCVPLCLLCPVVSCCVPCASCVLLQCMVPPRVRPLLTEAPLEVRFCPLPVHGSSPGIEQSCDGVSYTTAFAPPTRKKIR
jgi:hypothetical protein